MTQSSLSPNNEQTAFTWAEMTMPARDKLESKFSTTVAWLFFLVVSATALGDDSRMSYPDDFDEIPIGAYDSLGHAERVAYSIYWLEAEINNGGFHQFFFNSSGLRVVETLDALNVIGAQKTKDLLRRASEAAYEAGFPTDPTKHQELLKDDDETMESLNELDSLFYAYEDDLSGLVNQFLATSANH